MFNRFFNSQTKGIAGAAGILAVSGFLSRLLGLVRDRLLASTFGAGGELDSYFAAFRIPDFIYSLIIAGGIIVAFLPLFSEYFLKDKEVAWRFTNNLLNIFFLFLFLISLIIFLFAPALVKLITPGFDQKTLSLTILLTRILFLSPIFLGLSSIFSGILQYFNRFLIYSLTPIFYNLGIIFGILFFAPHFGILGVVFGVILGAFFHLVIQIPSAISSGFRYQPIFSFKDPGLKRFFLLVAPRIFAVTSWQISLIFVTAIASTLSEGSITIFNLANNLQHLPFGLVGLSFATAAFPFLSRSWANQKNGEFIKVFSSTFCQTLYFIVPITFLMYIFRNQIVEIVLKQGEFSQTAAQLTAASLGLFCLGMISFSLVPLISRAFFAFQDTKTPTLIVLTVTILIITLSFYFVWLLKSANFLSNFLIKFFSLSPSQKIAVLGLPLAFSIGVIFHFLLLMIFLYRRISNFKIREIFNFFSKILISSILMAVIAFFFIQNISGAIWQILIAGFFAGLVYLLLTFFFKLPQAQSIFKKFFYGKY